MRFRPLRQSIHSLCGFISEQILSTLRTDLSGNVLVAAEVALGILLGMGDEFIDELPAADRAELFDMFLFCHGPYLLLVHGSIHFAALCELGYQFQSLQVLRCPSRLTKHSAERARWEFLS